MPLPREDKSQGKILSFLQRLLINSIKSIKRRQSKMDNLTEQELKAVFDVVNVYEPEDISHVYPAMATDEFMEDIKSAWKKILKSLDNTNKN